MKRTAGWLDHQDVCLKLKISKRTLQTLRDNGTLAYTKIGNRTYYLPEDVERIVTKVEDRRKDARYRGHTIEGIELKYQQRQMSSMYNRIYIE